MKLLFDQDLSFKMCKALADLFPNSSHIKLIGLERASDLEVWEHAKASGFTLVSHDADFADMASMLGPIPKVIWLRCGNQPTSAIEAILRIHAEAIAIFAEDRDAAFLEVY